MIREGATVAVVARFAGSFAACEPNRAAARAGAPGHGGPKGLAEGGSAFTRGGRPCERRRTETNLFNRVSEIRGPLQEGRGRSLSIHKDEAFHQELRARTDCVEGRAELRERVRVEHSLAAVGRTQGKRARYKGLRKNLFDLRRHAAVVNLHAVERLAA